LIFIKKNKNETVNVDEVTSDFDTDSIEEIDAYA
jgi:hypothetical protein